MRAHHEYGAHGPPPDGAAFGAELERLMALYDRGRDRGPAQPPRQPRQPAVPDDGRPRPRRLPTSRCCSRRRCPARPCIYYGDEVGSRATSDPDCRRAFPVGRGALGPRTAWRGRAPRSRPATRTRAAPGVVPHRGARRRCGCVRPRWRPGGSRPCWWWSTPARRPVSSPSRSPSSPARARRRRCPLGGPAGQPVVVASDGSATVAVAARTGRVLVAGAARRA